MLAPGMIALAVLVVWLSVRSIHHLQLARDVAECGAVAIWQRGSVVGVETLAPVEKRLADVVAESDSIEYVGVGMLRDRPANAGIEHVNAMAGVRVLELSGLFVDEDISALRGPQTITRVNLGGTNVSDAGLLYLTRFSRLQSVMVRETRVTADGVRAFQRLAPGVDVEWDGNAPSLIE